MMPYPLTIVSEISDPAAARHARGPRTSEASPTGEAWDHLTFLMSMMNTQPTKAKQIAIGNANT